MARHRISIGIILLAVVLYSGQALAATRVALVIGNSAYKNSPLDNPVNDARDMAQALKRVGFKVIVKKNADKRSMADAIRNFGKEIARAEIGLFFYAGHGMQIDGINYLIPVKTRIYDETDIEFEAVNAGRILAKMQAAGNPLNIVILDACRDNPFKRSFRTSEKGLAKMDAPPGTLIAYSTSPGSLAEDGSGSNGTYTKALLDHIIQPGLDVQKMFNNTGLAVMEKTKSRQVPWISSTPIRSFYLAGGPGPEPSAPTVSAPTKAPQARQEERSPVHQAGDTWTEPITGMEFVWVEGGCYRMGDTFGDGFSDEKPVHEVCLDGFWMGKYEVTQGEYKKITGKNPSRSKGDRRPVEQVSWHDARAFIKELNSRSGKIFSLPSEAQWEYAARSGGKKEKYAGGNNIDTVAWYLTNSGYKTHDAGTKAPNGLGLYDMSGNVWEWCEDVYDDKGYEKHVRNNPLVTSGGSLRVRRGGSWYFLPRYVRAALRYRGSPSSATGNLGFRLIRKD